MTEFCQALVVNTYGAMFGVKVYECDVSRIHTETRRVAQQTAPDNTNLAVFYFSVYLI